MCARVCARVLSLPLRSVPPVSSFLLPFFQQSERERERERERGAGSWYARGKLEDPSDERNWTEGNSIYIPRRAWIASDQVSRGRRE